MVDDKKGILNDERRPAKTEKFDVFKKIINIKIIIDNKYSVIYIYFSKIRYILKPKKKTVNLMGLGIFKISKNIKF